MCRPHQLHQPHNNTQDHSLYDDPVPADPGSFRVPRLYTSNILDYCNCPGEYSEEAAAEQVACEGEYSFGAVTIGADGNQRPADPTLTRSDAKRMFLSAMVVMAAQVHAFVLMGTNAAHVHTTVHKHYYGLRPRRRAE